MAGRYFRGKIFSREDIFAGSYFRGKIFSREDIFAWTVYSRKYLLAKIFQIPFSRNFLPAKIKCYTVLVTDSNEHVYIPTSKFPKSIKSLSLRNRTNSTCMLFLSMYTFMLGLIIDNILRGQSKLRGVIIHNSPCDSLIGNCERGRGNHSYQLPRLQPSFTLTYTIVKTNRR